MMLISKRFTGMSILFVAGAFAAQAATDLTIQLPHGQRISRSAVQYRCDGPGVRMGLPAESFFVEYINGGGNSLAVLPIHGNSLIFVNVISGSGARYAPGPYIWWEESGRTVNLPSDSLSGKMRSECHRMKSK